MLNTEKKAWKVFEKLEEFYFDYEKFHWQQDRIDSKISTRRMTDAIANLLILLAVKHGTDAKKGSYIVKWARHWVRFPTSHKYLKSSLTFQDQKIVHFYHS